MHDPATGERLTIGGPQPGSELAWAGVFLITVAVLALNILARFITRQK